MYACACVRVHVLVCACVRVSAQACLYALFSEKRLAVCVYVSVCASASVGACHVCCVS